MFEELELGLYGRTNTGKIFIFAWLGNAEGEKYKDKIILFDGKIFDKMYYFKENEKLIKTSKNIKDILVEGDFVNGFKISEFDNELGEMYLGIPIFTDACMNVVEEVLPIENIDIYSIVTKEAFKENEFYADWFK